MDALDLDTPALYVDLDVLERNIARMQEQCHAWGVALRPHVKTHKIAEIAQMQLDAGAIGITVAKLGEAEVLPGDDVLVAYPLQKPKVPRLKELAKARRVKVAVDSVDGARDLHGIDRNLQRPSLRQLLQPRHLRLEQGIGDQYIVAGQHLRLAHFGNRDPDGAGRELQLRNLGDLVGLHVRPERHTPRATMLLHPRDVALERVEVDVERGCVEVERGH